MAVGSHADPFASSCLLSDHCYSNKTTLRRALNFPLSSRSVGLITTSFSLLQPLRIHRTLRETKMHLPRIWLSWTVTLWWTLPHPVFGVCSSSPLQREVVVVVVGGSWTTSLLLSRDLFSRQSRPLLISAVRDLFLWTCFHQRRENNWGISEESLPRRKDSYELSYLHVLFFFFDLSLFIFFSYLV